MGANSCHLANYQILSARPFCRKSRRLWSCNTFFWPDEQHSICQWSPQAREYHRGDKEVTNSGCLSSIRSPEDYPFLLRICNPSPPTLSLNHGSLTWGGAYKTVLPSRIPLPKCKHPWEWTHINPDSSVPFINSYCQGTDAQHDNSDK